MLSASNHSLSAMLQANTRLLARERRSWAVERSSEWFELAMDPARMTDDRFRKHFRVSRAFLLWLKDELKPDIKCKKTWIRSPIKAKVKVGLTLYRLAHGTGYRQLAEHFAVGESTADNAFKEVCTAIKDRFHGVLRWEDGLAGEQNRDWYAFKGLPGAIGAVDGTHFQASRMGRARALPQSPRL